MISCRESRRAGNHGSCIQQNKYPIQDDKCNYHDSLQACLIGRIYHLHKTFIIAIKENFCASEGTLPYVIPNCF